MVSNRGHFSIRTDRVGGTRNSNDLSAENRSKPRR